jgi:4-hydroxybenzoate polyprenyltransferase
MALGAVMFFIVGYDNSNNAQALLAGLGVALLLANVTYYKHRKRQFMVNRVVVMVAFVLEGWLLYGTYGVEAGTLPKEGFLPLAAPLLAVIFVALANRAIQADEKKVQSADRFRK